MTTEALGRPGLEVPEYFAAAEFVGHLDTPADAFLVEAAGWERP